MADCRNPECRNGVTPGVIASGRGSSKSPLVGATMRWGWCNCRACSPKDKDPPYAHVNRTAAEIAERARMADSKVTYEAKQVTAPLARLKVPSAANGATPPPDNSAQLTKLLDTISKLSDQVAELLEENRQLRAEREAGVPKKSRVKKELATRAKPS